MTPNRPENHGSIPMTGMATADATASPTHPLETHAHANAPSPGTEKPLGTHISRPTEAAKTGESLFLHFLGQGEE